MSSLKEVTVWFAKKDAAGLERLESHSGSELIAPGLRIAIYEAEPWDDNPSLYMWFIQKDDLIVEKRHKGMTLKLWYPEIQEHNEHPTNEWLFQNGQEMIPDEDGVNRVSVNPAHEYFDEAGVATMVFENARLARAEAMKPLSELDVLFSSSRDRLRGGHRLNTDDTRLSGLATQYFMKLGAYGAAMEIMEASLEDFRKRYYMGNVAVVPIADGLEFDEDELAGPPPGTYPLTEEDYVSSPS